jgi:hypothetical protein
MASKIKVDTLETANGSGTITSSNPITVTGALTATTVVGNGAALTSLPVLGVSQTWQNLTSSRAKNTTYTNSSGKAIYVMVSHGVAGSGLISATVAGAASSIYIWAGTGFLTPFIVPVGATYSLTDGTGSVGGLFSWMELR